MKVKMLASMRSHTARGLTMLEKQTKAAAREAGKAFLPTMDATTQLSRVAIARDALPVGDAQSEVWEAELPIVVTYRDAIFMVAVEVNKTLTREKEYGNEDAANATRAQLDEIQELMRALGDQRDLFAEFDDEKEVGEDEESADETQMEMELVES